MMTDKEMMLGRIYDEIADSLNISATMAKKAIASYISVGQWLSGADYIGDVKIMPQGSFNLGTVIKPLSDEDSDYDIDLVCLIKSGSSLNEKTIKTIIGKRLRESILYSEKLEREGKRCWTLDYAGFHMDILPCVPKEGIYIAPYLTGIRLTHKTDNGLYEARFSNPAKYHHWFEEQMQITLLEEKRIFALKRNLDIESVETYEVRTPLQKSIQLLKRHRDVMFEGKTNAPISIIITTLAALAYNNEQNVYDSIKNIIKKMPLYIKWGEDGTFHVQNPVIREENFADKWNEEPERSEAFYRWLQKAESDIIDNPLSVTGLKDVSDKIQMAFGKTITMRAIKGMAEKDRIAREKGTLYVTGLTGGITATGGTNTKVIGGHTFFGYEK